MKAEQSPLKLMLWAGFAGLLFGLLGLGDIAEDMLRSGRNNLHPHKASGDIVLVAIDDTSVREEGRWPWPREAFARLTDELTEYGSRRIFFDVLFEAATHPSSDRQLAEAFERSGRVVLPVRGRAGPDKLIKTEPAQLPHPLFRDHAELGSINVDYNYQSAVWRIPYDVAVGDGSLPSFAKKLANHEGGTGTFVADYSIDPRSVPVISASDILAGRTDKKSIEGKDIVVGVTTDAVNDHFFLPGWGRMAGSYVQIIGAETLKTGTPVVLGWLPAFLFALALAALLLLRTSQAITSVLIVTGATLLIGPALLESHLVFLDVVPALVVVAVVGGSVAWRRWQSGGLVNAASGLPNLAALQSDRSGHDRALIVAKILNYAEISAAMPPEKERQLVEQIVARLSVGAPDRTLFHGDGGIFAWFEEPRLPFANHVEALHALFRNPARIGSMTVDLTVSFGVEIGSSRSLANRLASALVAADEAAHDGLKWKYHDPETLQNASWKLSMLSQLDDAVDKGEIWVAFQPKLDLASRKIIGAEALARWTHPEKGPIAASEFISAAEQHDRIGKLTDFVLDHAIKAATQANSRQPGFGMAVNLSARLLSDKGFTLRLAAMLARHRLRAELLTLELTETAELAASGHAIDMLAALCELGVNISIDDYGTGLSTLDYLKKVPANEIKIDQSFVRGMIDNRSDLVMVQSTIALAHSLGRRVVAEGVEKQALLDLLVDMKCDVAQGYIIGRPMSLDSLMKRISSNRGSRVA